MSEFASVEKLAKAVNAALENRSKSFDVRATGGKKPRFELYHSPISLCSQKVRTVLAEKNAAFTSHEMEIITLRTSGGEVVPADNYHPSYVRLRLHGARSLGRPLVSAYSGTTSVETEGFDACVVPLLVDHERGEVVADSLRICSYIDQEIGGRSLKPAGTADAVMVQVKIVDRLPNGRFLYGYHPDDDQRPDELKHVMADIYQNKVAALGAYIHENADDIELVAAYRSKIAKEAGGLLVQRDPAFQREGRAMAERAVRDLEIQLRSHQERWLCGTEFTLADAIWGAQLFRLQYLGIGKLWADRPRVTKYIQELYRRPSVREEVINASGRSLPPSRFTAEVLRREPVA